MKNLKETMDVISEEDRLCLSLGSKRPDWYQRSAAMAVDEVFSGMPYEDREAAFQIVWLLSQDDNLSNVDDWEIADVLLRMLTGASIPQAEFRSVLDNDYYDYSGIKKAITDDMFAERL